MTSIAHTKRLVVLPVERTAESMASVERHKSLVLRAWIFAGLFFMALPGTVLGFSNLLAISTNHGLGNLPAAWIQGHGHAQVFGWIGSFVLGIGFYSQPARSRSVLWVPLTSFALWTSGVAMRWTADIYGWHWRMLFAVSSTFELIALVLFLKASSHHKMPEQIGDSRTKARMELWMVSVLVSTAGLAALVIFNFVVCMRLALGGTSRAFPHALDQIFLLLLAWGFLVPVVWGFSARWFPTFLAIAKPNAKVFGASLALDITGVICGIAGWTQTATILLLLSALSMGWALHLTQKPHGPAKTQGIHRSFPVFARLSYVWLVIAGCLGVWAAFADVHGGIWGASRHALTVGFAATMVFTIGPRILPHFSGIYNLFSKRLMLLSLLLLQIGCTLRVLSEPLAYEGIQAFAWKTLPISGVLELSGVVVFAINMALTLITGRAFWQHNVQAHAA
ncbi:MAG: hypothetical protein KGN79_08875 [Acidobacteriota bacterium]|nr:hypothetical protein [Acidobacteriota bacterium]